jgi:hypothetical protein
VDILDYLGYCKVSGKMKIDHKFSEDKSALFCKGWRMDMVDSCRAAPRRGVKGGMTSTLPSQLAA